MSRNVYIAATESSSGKSAIALGMMEMMIKQVGHVGFFRPIISTERGGTERDNDIALISSHFRLDRPYEETYAYTRREANELISKGAKLAFPIREGVPIMLPEEARQLD